MRARGKLQIHRGQDRTGFRGEHKMEATAVTEGDPGRERWKGWEEVQEQGSQSWDWTEGQGFLFGYRGEVFKDGNGCAQSVGVKPGSRGRQYSRYLFSMQSRR